MTRLMIMRTKRRGMSLMEMMIAMFIITLAMGGFSTLFIDSWRQNAYVLETGQAVAVASQGVNKISKFIRETRQSDNGAYPVVSADDSNLVFYCDYDSDGVTERIHLYLNGTDVVMGIREPSGGFPVTYANGDGSTQILAQRVVNTASNPIFAYYDATYPEDSANNPIATPATVPDVRLVRVTLHINIDPNNDPENIQVQSFAEMRNLNDHDRFGI